MPQTATTEVSWFFKFIDVMANQGLAIALILGGAIFLGRMIWKLAPRHFEARNKMMEQIGNAVENLGAKSPPLAERGVVALEKLAKIHEARATSDS